MDSLTFRARADGGPKAIASATLVGARDVHGHAGASTFAFAVKEGTVRRHWRRVSTISPGPTDRRLPRRGLSIGSAPPKALPGVSIVEPGFIRDEGMHVDRGVSLPWRFRTSTPHQVDRAVIRAIERNVAETVVAPPEQRLALALGRPALAFNAKGQQLVRMNLESAGGADRS
jgi:hypothetical protein